MIQLSRTTCLVLAIAGGLAAQGPHNPPLNAEQMVSRRVERLTAQLSLTVSQADAARKIFTDEQTAASTQFTGLNTAQEKLRAAVKSNSEAIIDAAAAEIGAIQGRLSSIHGKAQARFLGLLTQAQREKLESLPDRGPGGRGGPGGRPGGGRF